MEQLVFNIHDETLKQQIEEYLLEVEKRHQGQKIIFVIGDAIWDKIYEMEQDGRFEFGNIALRLNCDDATKFFEYYIDEGSSIYNGFVYSKMIRVFKFEEKGDFVV